MEDSSKSSSAEQPAGNCSKCNVQTSTPFYGMCLQCYNIAMEHAYRNQHRVKLYLMSGAEYMPLGVSDFGAKVAVETILGMPFWPARPPTGFLVNGFKLDPSLPIGLFPPEDQIYVLFGDILSLPCADQSVVSRPCADVRDVETPPTPSPR